MLYLRTKKKEEWRERPSPASILNIWLFFFFRHLIMESGVISQQNTVYVLNATNSYRYGVSCLFPYSSLMPRLKGASWTMKRTFCEGSSASCLARRKKLRHKWMNGSFNPSFLFLFLQSGDMMNFFLTPAVIKDDSKKYAPANNTIMQTKIPQTVVEHSAETFNDKTRRSLCKINLFIKRLKWFNIFADTTATTTTTKAQKSAEINQKW